MNLHFSFSTVQIVECFVDPAVHNFMSPVALATRMWHSWIPQMRRVLLTMLAFLSSATGIYMRSNLVHVKNFS